MKFSLNFLKTHGLKLILLVCLSFLAWVVFVQYQTLDQVAINPPAVEQNQVTARQVKVNAKVIEWLSQNHELKKGSAIVKLPSFDPFAPLVLDTKP